MSLAFERALTDVISIVDVALQDATTEQSLSAYNSLVTEDKHKKRFANKEKCLDAIWAALDNFAIDIKARKVLAVAEQIGLKIAPAKLESLRNHISEYKAPVTSNVVSISTATPKVGANKVSEKGAKAATNKTETPAKTTASGRTGELISVFKAQGKDLHVDDLSKLMNTTVLTIRNTIDAARRGKHVILSMGKGVFHYENPEAPAPKVAEASAEAVAETVAETPAKAVKKPKKEPKPKKKAAVAPVAEEPAAVAEPVAEPSEEQPAPAPEEPVVEQPEPLSEPLNISQGDDSEEVVETEVHEEAEAVA